MSNKIIPTTEKINRVVSFEQVKSNSEIKALIETANQSLALMGFTDHGRRHVSYTSKTAANILKALGYSQREQELAAITGYLHDVGNCINRKNHGLTGAMLAYEILSRMKMDPNEVIMITGAIGNHEEETGTPLTAVSAASAIADKSDAHKSRVSKQALENPEIAKQDIHNRVNLSILKNFITVDKENKIIKLKIFMDTKISSPMEFLQIYMLRMTMCENAAKLLGCSFELIINRTAINKSAPPTGDVLQQGETNVSDE